MHFKKFETRIFSYNGFFYEKVKKFEIDTNFETVVTSTVTILKH